MSVSLCLMVRNEEEQLAACLQSAADLVDETIVVDTASTDGTRELATKLAASVIQFPWCDDFAAGQMRAHCVISKSVCAWQRHSTIEGTIAH